MQHCGSINIFCHSPRKESGTQSTPISVPHVLEKDIAGELSAVRARQQRRLPVVLTAKEIQGVFDHMSGTPKLMAMIIYGCGLRLQECLTLRIKDVDLEQN